MRHTVSAPMEEDIREDESGIVMTVDEEVEGRSEGESIIQWMHCTQYTCMYVCIIHVQCFMM